eukprot:810717-Rhodomonas_salina.1
MMMMRMMMMMTDDDDGRSQHHQHHHQHPKPAHLLNHHRFHPSRDSDTNPDTAYLGPAQPEHNTTYAPHTLSIAFAPRSKSVSDAAVPVAVREQPAPSFRATMLWRWTTTSMAV